MSYRIGEYKGQSLNEYYPDDNYFEFESACTDYLQNTKATTKLSWEKFLDFGVRYGWITGGKFTRLTSKVNT